MRQTCARSLITLALLFGLSSAAAAQTAGSATVQVRDSSTGAVVPNVGDTTNSAMRVNIVAGAGSGGTAIGDNAAFTQGSTSETPAAGVYATSWTNPTAGHATVFRADINGGIYANLDKVGTNAILTGNGATGTGSLRVTVASDNTAFTVNAAQSGTWTVQPGNTPNTTPWLIKQTRSTSGTLSNVAASATNVTVLASNSNRLGAMVFNDSTVALYLKFGATASTTSFTVKLDGGAYYEVPIWYTGQLDGLWTSATGSARVTEVQ